MITLTPSCKYKDLYIQIMSDKITPELLKVYFNGLEIYYDINLPCITASMIIRDPIQFVQYLSDNFVEIYYVDIYDKFVYRRFRIYDIVTIVKAEKEAIYDIQMIDEISYYYMKETVDDKRLYKNMTMFKAYDTIFSKHIGDWISSLQLSYKTKNTLETFETIWVNAEESFLSFFYKNFYREGYKLFQTKKSVSVSHIKDLIPSVCPLHPWSFTNLQNTHFYKGQMLAHNIVSDGRNKNIVRNEPEREIYVFDSEKKEIKILKQNVLDIYNDVKLTKKDNSKLQQTKNHKEYVSQDQLTDDNIYANTYEKFLSNVQLEFVVAGDAELDIYKRIEVEFTEDSIRTNSLNEGSPKYSGQYLITSLVDKFEGGTFVQKVIANRLDVEDPIEGRIEDV